nr:hypothetical protein [Tanacetum cinerariifolium]
VVLEEKGEEFGLDSKEDEVVPRVKDVSLVDRVLEGAFGGDGDDEFSIDDDNDETEEGTSYVSTPSPNSYVNSLSNDVLQVILVCRVKRVSMFFSSWGGLVNTWRTSLDKELTYELGEGAEEKEEVE